MEQDKKEYVNLVIHGFGGDINEIDYLVKYLQAEGFDTYAVSLAGHGGTKKELTASSYVDWIESVKKEIEELTPKYKNINLIGFSLGGLICIHFASMPEINKVVFINTPIYFWNVKVIIKDIISDIRNKKTDKISYYQKSIFGVSLKSSIDFLKILRQTKKMFKDVLKPSLILQCIDDESVRFKSAEYIKKKIGRFANIHYYDGGCHQVFNVSIGLRDLICNDICKFLVP